MLTKDLPDDNPKKFSGRDSKSMSWSYRRLVDPSLGGISPPTSQVITDINRIPRSMMMVYEEKGIRIDNNNLVSGRRYGKNEKKVKI